MIRAHGRGQSRPRPTLPWPGGNGSIANMQPFAPLDLIALACFVAAWSGYAIMVEAFKEREDLPGIAANSPGAATFSESTPFSRDLSPVVGQRQPSRWIPVGRDLDLEQAILTSLRAAYTG